MDPYDRAGVNHYEVLGVVPDSEPGEIRKAYLAAARRYHPDFHADADATVRAGNARRMQELNQAWEVLGDPTARAAYDRSLRSADDPGVARRVAREREAQQPQVPKGKGWTPRADDDGWQRDYRAWADEDDIPPADLPPEGARRGLVRIAPVALFALAGCAAFLGVVLGSRTLVAVSIAAGVVSAALFVILPMVIMTRRR